VVAHLVRLKLTLLRNIFRRSRAQAIGAVLGILYFGGLVVMAAVGVAALRADLPEARLYVPLGGAVLILAWGLLPLLTFGTDPTLDPARFTTFAIPYRQLATGLVLAGLLGLPAIACALVIAGTLVTWSVSVLATVVAVISAAAGLLTCVTLSRWVSALASTAMSSRRGRDVTAILGLVVVIGLGPGLGLAGSTIERFETVMPTVGTIAGWTPLGWIWAAPADIAVGEVGTGLLRLVLGLAVVIGLGLLWQRAVRRQVEDPNVIGGPAESKGHRGLGLLGRFPDSETGAIAAQIATYWQRDPRYQVGLLMAPITPLFLLIPSLAAGTSWTVLLMGPLIAFLIGWSEHNSVAYESTAFWMHVAAGTRGRADRLARLVPSLVLAAVLIPIYCVVGAWLGGRFDLLPAIVGVSVALAGVGYGLSCVMSVVMPYAVPKPGESPFTTPPGGQGARMLAQTISSLGTAVLASPVILLALLTWWERDWALWPTALSGILLGAGVFALGVRVGGRIYDRRAPEVLAGLVRD
jgi:ABC-2 type transport system permease protein